MVKFTIPGFSTESTPDESSLIRQIGARRPSIIEYGEGILDNVVANLPSNSSQTPKHKATFNYDPKSSALKPELNSSQTVKSEVTYNPSELQKNKIQHVVNGALQATSHQEIQQQIIYDANVEAARQGVDDAFAGSN